jgi:carbohydrate ABC transporter membrane protein 1, CUT1 family (TC 3.A.1.1.-)
VESSLVMYGSFC